MTFGITTRACGNCIGRAMGVERFPGAKQSAMYRAIEKLLEGAHRPAAQVFFDEDPRTPDNGKAG